METTQQLKTDTADMPMPVAIGDDDMEPANGGSLWNHPMVPARQLPSPLRELVANAPDNFRRATFFVCSAFLGVYATRLRFLYPYDQMPSACLLQVVVCGEQSSGKSFARNLERVLMSMLRAHDSEQRRLEQEYREKMRAWREKSKGKSMEDMPVEPKTDVRTMTPTMSISMLVKRADMMQRIYGAPLTLCMFADELSIVTQSNKRAFSDLMQIMKTAFDLGSEYGQDYLSETSYSAMVDICMNTVFCGTPAAVDAYFTNKALEGGNVTRTIFCELDYQLGEDAPRFKAVSPGQQAQIDRVIQLMMNDTYSSTGMLAPEIWMDMEWLKKTIYGWCEDRRMEVIKSGDKALDVFYKRSSVIAFRIAALCQYLYGLDGEAKAVHAKVRQIYLASADYILTGMMRKWGARYAEIADANMHPSHCTLSNLFDSLPATFNRNLLKETIAKMGLKTYSYVFLSQWKRKKLVRQVSKHVFTKIGAGL